MDVELLMIGTELLLGQIQDTNAAFMAKLLAEHGINLRQKVTVGDNPERIKTALDAALTRSGVVLCSGGLGPTEDDITRECIAELMDCPLVYDPALFEIIRQRFVQRHITITENNKKQAMVPRGGRVIPNPNGTAPGLIIDTDRGIIICMPGVPHELEAMMRDSVLPFLRERAGLPGVVHSRVLKVCGMGESRVDSMIGDLMRVGGNPTIGLLASIDVTRIRITARAETIDAANALIDPIDAAVRSRIPDGVMGTDEDTLEGVVDRLLLERGWTLALAEVHTGGVLAHRLTAAETTSFRGARVFASLEGGGDVREKALDMARRVLLECQSSCGLAMVPDHEGQRTLAALVTPEGDTVCELGLYGAGARSQLRMAIASLEQLRRFLLTPHGFTN